MPPRRRRGRGARLSRGAEPHAHLRRVARQRRPRSRDGDVNFRYAPHRSHANAEARLRELVGAPTIEMLGHSPAAPVAVRNPLVAAPPRRRRLRADPEAGVDARRAVHGARTGRGELRPRRDAVRAHAGRADRGRRRSSGPSTRSASSVRRLQACTSPPSSPPRPSIRSSGSRRRSGARPRRASSFDFGMGDPREPTDPLIKRALAKALDEATGYPTAVGFPSTARPSAAGRSAASASARP